MWCNLWAGGTSCWRLYLTCRGKKAKHTERYLLYFNFEFQTASCRLAHAVYLKKEKKKKKKGPSSRRVYRVSEKILRPRRCRPPPKQNPDPVCLTRRAVMSPVNLFRLQTGVNIRVLTQVFRSRRKVLNHICWKNSLSLPGTWKYSIFYCVNYFYHLNPGLVWEEAITTGWRH